MNNFSTNNLPPGGAFTEDSSPPSLETSEKGAARFGIRRSAPDRCRKAQRIRCVKANARALSKQRRVAANF